MSILRAVQLQFKPGESPETIKNLGSQILELKNNCAHPNSQRSYIKSIKFGADNSPEGLQDGVTHAIFMEFESVADRDYYALKDPVHQDFIKVLQKHLEKIRIVDITDGVF